MTEPNRDTTNEPNHDGEASPLPSAASPVLPGFRDSVPPSTTPADPQSPQIPQSPQNSPLPSPASPQSPHSPSSPWQPDPSLRPPGIFTRDATILPSTPGDSFVCSLRHVVTKGFGKDWHVRRLSDDTARVWSRTHDVDFDVAIRRPAARGDDFVTTVDHVVDRPDIAAALERLLGDHPERVSEITSLIVGFVREPVPDKPSEFHLRVGIGNRWPVHPSAAEEHRLAEFAAWNIQVLLWLRYQARRQIHILLTAPRPAEIASQLPSFTAAQGAASQNTGGNERSEFTPADPQSPQSPQSPQISPLPSPASHPLASPASPQSPHSPSPPASPQSPHSPSPRLPRLEKGWESFPWPLGGNPFGAAVPWVGLCSPAIFQPLAFDIGYWLEYWAKPEVGGSGSISLIEAVRRALPVHLDADWRIEYRGPTHHFLRHPKHPWIFEITQRKTGISPGNPPDPFGIIPPGGAYCPTSTAYDIRLVCTTAEQADAVVREVCDRRAGTSDITTSFFRDLSAERINWSIRAHISSHSTTPSHPQRHARPGFDVSRWWSSPHQHPPFDTLRVLWALKILHASCLRHGLTPFGDAWRR